MPCMHFNYGSRRGLYVGSRSARVYGNEDQSVAKISGTFGARVTAYHFPERSGPDCAAQCWRMKSMCFGMAPAQLAMTERT